MADVAQDKRCSKVGHRESTSKWLKNSAIDTQRCPEAGYRNRTGKHRQNKAL